MVFLSACSAFDSEWFDFSFTIPVFLSHAWTAWISVFFSINYHCEYLLAIHYHQINQTRPRLIRTSSSIHSLENIVLMTRPDFIKQRERNVVLLLNRMNSLISIQHFHLYYYMFFIDEMLISFVALIHITDSSSKATLHLANRARRKKRYFAELHYEIEYDSRGALKYYISWVRSWWTFNFFQDHLNTQDSY